MARILFDLDNTGVNFLGPLLDRVNDLRRASAQPPNARPSDVADWAMSVGFAPDETELIAKTWKEPGYFRSLLPFPGFVETVQWAKDAGHEPVIVTASSLSHVLAEKAEWNKEFLPMLSYRDVIYAEQKAMVQGDALIDDASKHVVAYRKAWPDSLILVPAHTFNQDVTPDQGTRIEGCEDMAGFWDRARAALEARFGKSS